VSLPGFSREKLLGNERWARCYLARQPATGATVLQYHVLPDLAPTLPAERVLPVRALLDTLGGVTHPALCNVLEVEWPMEGVPRISLECPRGTTAEEIVAATGRLSQPAAVTLLDRVAAGVEALHRAQLTAGSTPPSRLFVRPSGADLASMTRLFGAGLPSIAASLLDVRFDASHHLFSELFPAAPYVAPEVLDGDGPSPASDMFSLGGLAYFLLSGLDPFDGGTALLLRHAMTRGPSKPLDAIVPDVDPALAAFVQQALEADPDRRPTPVRALREVLAPLVPAVPPWEPGSPLVPLAICVSDTTYESRFARRLELLQGGGMSLSALASGEPADHSAPVDASPRARERNDEIAARNLTVDQERTLRTALNQLEHMRARSREEVGLVKRRTRAMAMALGLLAAVIVPLLLLWLDSLRRPEEPPPIEQFAPSQQALPPREIPRKRFIGGDPMPKERER